MPLRVLIVDDNADTRVSLAMLCRTWGYQVRMAEDGLAALEAAQEFLPDAILLDIGLPRLDGFEVTERLRALPDFRDTFIVVSSGYSRDADLRRAAELGIDLYLVKPFNPSRLEAALDALAKPSPTALSA